MLAEIAIHALRIGQPSSIRLSAMQLVRSCSGQPLPSFHRLIEHLFDCVTDKHSDCATRVAAADLLICCDAATNVDDCSLHQVFSAAFGQVVERFGQTFSCEQTEPPLCRMRLAVLVTEILRNYQGRAELLRSFTAQETFLKCLVDCFHKEDMYLHAVEFLALACIKNIWVRPFPWETLTKVLMLLYQTLSHWWSLIETHPLTQSFKLLTQLYHVLHFFLVLNSSILAAFNAINVVPTSGYLNFRKMCLILLDSSADLFKYLSDHNELLSVDVVVQYYSIWNVVLSENLSDTSQMTGMDAVYNALELKHIFKEDAGLQMQIVTFSLRFVLCLLFQRNHVDEGLPEIWSQGLSSLGSSRNSLCDALQTVEGLSLTSILVALSLISCDVLLLIKKLPINWPVIEAQCRCLVRVTLEKGHLVSQAIELNRGSFTIPAVALTMALTMICVATKQHRRHTDDSLEHAALYWVQQLPLSSIGSVRPACNSQLAAWLLSDGQTACAHRETADLSGVVKELLLPSQGRPFVVLSSTCVRSLWNLLVEQVLNNKAIQVCQLLNTLEEMQPSVSIGRG